MKLKDLRKESFTRGETYYKKIGLPLLTHEGTGKVLEKRRVSSSAIARASAHGVELVVFDTVVATFLKKGGMQLNCGGWRTRFTRHTMNGLLPAGQYLVSDGGIWTFTTGTFDTEGGIPYTDGCVVYENGKVKGAMTKSAAARRQRQFARSKNFTKRFVERFMAGKIEKPSMGDCLYCQLESGTQKFDSSVVEPGGTVRAPSSWEAADHVRRHIQEGYFVPSMLVNACKQRYGEIPIAVLVMFQWYWSQDGKETEGCVVSASYTTIHREVARRYLVGALRSYLCKAVGAEFGGRGWQS